MAKIVLVWNTHPNESPVTRPLALELEKNLKSRGHEVSIIKVPFNQTLHGRFKNQPDKKPLEIMGRDDDFINELLKKNKDSFFIDLHTTSEEVLSSKFKKSKIKPKHFNVNEYNLKEEKLEKMFSPIELSHYKPRCWVVELASKYTKSTGVFKKIREGREVFTGHPTYFEEVADLKKTKASNYLTPLAVRKLVHSIDRAVNTQVRVLEMGKGYRTPRGKLHQGKGVRVKRKSRPK